MERAVVNRSFQRDWAAQTAARTGTLRPGWFPLAGAGLGLLLILGFTAFTDQDVSASASLPRTEWIAAAIPHPPEAARTRETRLRPGGSAFAALSRLGFSATDIAAMRRAARAVHPLNRVRAGHGFRRVDLPDGRARVEYRIDAEHRLLLTQAADGGWQAAIKQRQVFARQRIASGVIRDSLFAAAQAAGLDDRTTMNLVDIFAWDIDFARDIQPGDSFRLLYEERFDAEGHELGSRILAAEFINRGKRFRAVRYVNAAGEAGYYTPDGRSMRKNYLKAPVKFSRISSRFTLARKHPILGYTRAHRGVDYAAPAGTPVHAVGDGRVVFAGWKGGYGRFLLIRHANRNHSTAYAHLRAFARGIRRGAHVRQGQVIGYVGMTGLATGPHLHFEFRVRGRAVNPLTIRRRPARPVPKTEMARFRQQTAPFVARLNEATHEPDWG